MPSRMRNLSRKDAAMWSLLLIRSCTQYRDVSDWDFRLASAVIQRTFVVCSVLVPEAYPQPLRRNVAGKPPVRIIDIHTHPAFFNADVDRGEIQQLIDRAKGYGVERMVVLGDVLRYGRLPTARQISRINDQTARLTEWHPGYFTGFCYVNPVLGARHVAREIRRCAALGFRGIKLEVSCNAADRRMTPVMEEAESLSLPVLQHTADQTHIRQRSFHSDPIDTATLGRRFPRVQIIMAHLTAVGVRGVREVEDVPNIVVDTSAFQPVAGLVGYAVGRLGSARVVYGSDLVIRDLGSSIGRVLAAGLSKRQEQDVLFNNANRILGLNDGHAGCDE